MTKKRDMASRALDLFVKEYGNTKQIALGCPECRFQEAREHSRCWRHDPCRTPAIRRGTEEIPRHHQRV